MKPEKKFIPGVCKAILSGDTVIIRGHPDQGLPPEKILQLAYVSAPKLARRPTENGQLFNDEPYAWQSRETLRKLIIGRDVLFCVLYSAVARDYGSILLNGHDITAQLVSEGAVRVRELTPNSPDKHRELINLENKAKLAKVGMFQPKSAGAIRTITWQITNPEDYLGKQFEAVVENVKDGSSLRLLLLPSFAYATLSLSGIKCPSKDDPDNPEFYEEAKYFTEVRLLHRTVLAHLQGTLNGIFLGTIMHPAGNISECLLKEGFAKIVEWSMKYVSPKCQASYRAAESFAKQYRWRLFREYSASSACKLDNSEFQAVVEEIVNGASVVIRRVTDGTRERIFFSSLRQPQAATAASGKTGRDQPTGESRAAEARDSSAPRLQYYQIPWLFEAREFLRHKLLGKTVSVKVDYLRAPLSGASPKKMCTIMLGSCNVGEALIGKGLAKVIPHRMNDNDRSLHYEALVRAEAAAKAQLKGVHQPANKAPVHRFVEVTSHEEAVQHLPLVRHNKMRFPAMVEGVLHGSRLKILIIQDKLIINFILSGIRCPRLLSKNAGDGAPPEPYAEEAYNFTKNLCFQRDVEIQVDGLDMAGSYTGSLWVKHSGVWKNLSLQLLKSGLASLRPSASRLLYKQDLYKAERAAIEERLKIWENYTERTASDGEGEHHDKMPEYQKVHVSEVTSPTHVWFQPADKLDELKPDLMRLNETFTGRAPSQDYWPVVNALCCAKFGDNVFYRARIEVVDNEKRTAHIFYIDYGNKEETSFDNLYELPEAFWSPPPLARELRLALLAEPDDEDWAAAALDFVSELLLDKSFLLNIKYQENGKDYGTLTDPETKVDVGTTILLNGLALCKRRRGSKFKALLDEYEKCESKLCRKGATSGSTAT
ncbi:staphylococcal nuclease domain-containing protein 1-like isoform X2 [Zophobas morio]|uniref:staphylococcal nuclease domain-containing protein 1-like isoform X2 n=1 Tax=Zophobas morio TaxID=2755281 RepID=UPI003083B6FE